MFKDMLKYILMIIDWLIKFVKKISEGLTQQDINETIVYTDMLITKGLYNQIIDKLNVPDDESEKILQVDYTEGINNTVLNNMIYKRSTSKVLLDILNRGKVGDNNIATIITINEKVRNIRKKLEAIGYTRFVIIKINEAYIMMNTKVSQYVPIGTIKILIHDYEGYTNMDREENDFTNKRQFITMGEAHDMVTSKNKKKNKNSIIKIEKVCVPVSETKPYNNMQIEWVLMCKLNGYKAVSYSTCDAALILGNNHMGRFETANKKLKKIGKGFGLYPYHINV